MIKIDLDHKLRKTGLNRQEFETIFANKLLDYQHKAVTRRAGSLYDRFGLGLNLARSRDVKIRLDEVFLRLYLSCPDLKNYIDTFFSPIASNLDARQLLKDIILLPPNDLKYTVNSIGSFPSPSSIGKIFDYSRDNDLRVRPSFTDIGFKVCTYCNRNYTSNFTTRGSQKATFTLDHFYQKGDLPIFSLSLYNLIPACAVCNTNIKNTRNVNHYENPYSEHYDFHNKAKFKLLPHYNVKLVTSDADCFEYIKHFYINEVYKTHTIEVKEFVKKREVFTDDMIRKIAQLTRHSEIRVKSSLFGESIYNKNIGNESLGKLKADLGKELGLT